MIYNVASLLTAREGTTRVAEINSEEIFADRHHFFGINGPVRLMRTDRTVLVSASVEATVSDTCGRCLGPAEIKLSAEFEEEFEPVNFDLVADRPAPVEPDFDPALVIDSRNMLDMTEALGQALSLAMPLALVCREDCAGICTTCYSNRNRSSCRCAENAVDPRWEALAGLNLATSNSAEKS